MLEAYSRAWAEIDYDAIAHNCDEVQKSLVQPKSWELSKPTRMDMVILPVPRYCVIGA